MFSAAKPLEALAPLHESGAGAGAGASSGASNGDPKLPRGECSFILPDPDPDTGGRQRCVCRTFWYDRDVPGSRCQCGHGAWTHEPDPVGSVTMEEHLAVVQKLKFLEDELRKERGAREEMARTYNDGFRSVFNHMAHFVRETGAHMLRLDDKIESVMDKTHDNVNELDKLRLKIENVDENAMELENKIDRLGLADIPAVRPSSRRSIQSNVDMDAPEQLQLGNLPIRDKKAADRWSSRVIFVPSREQKRAYAFDTVAFKRCESRNLNQELTFNGRNSQVFTHTVEKAFAPVLRSRSWMPLMCYRESDLDRYSPTALRQLPPEQRLAPFWDYEFLERQCVSADKMQGDVIYIALMLDDLTWNDIKLLPASPNTLAAAAANVVTQNDLNATTPTATTSPFIVDPQPFWAHDDELDGPVGYKNLDSVMYDYTDPPPYSSRSSRRRSSLDRILRATLGRPGSSGSSNVAKSPRLPPIDADGPRRPGLPTMEPNRLQTSAVPPSASSPSRGLRVIVDSTGRIRSPVPPPRIPTDRPASPITHRRGDANRVQSPLEVLASASVIEKQRTWMTSVTAASDNDSINALPIFGENGIVATTSINVDSATASVTSGPSNAPSLHRPDTAASTTSSLRTPPTAAFAPLLTDDEHRDKRTRLPGTRGSTATSVSNASGVSFGSVSSISSTPAVATASSSQIHDSTHPHYPPSTPHSHQTATSSSSHHNQLHSTPQSNSHHHNNNNILAPTPPPQPPQQQQQTVYLSGRSKRKVPTKAAKDTTKKGTSTPLQSFLHRHQGSKDKESAGGASGSGNFGDN